LQLTNRRNRPTHNQQDNETKNKKRDTTEH
jgi:hypothetical protein